MNAKMIGKYLGYLILAEAVFLFPSAAVALIYKEPHALAAILAASAACAILAAALLFFCRGESSTIYAREGFVVAGLGWLLLSLFGALPFFLSGEIPHFIDAFFESSSGFTTTGASILPNVEVLSKSLLFWRSFTHWLGGIGVLAFILAVVRSKSGAGFTLHLLRAETPGPQVGKIMPKTHDSVRTLFIIYFSLSFVNLVFLLTGKMPLFDALCTMFGTAGTGGFGIKADSMASYSPYLQAVTTVFMALFGVNFTLYHFLTTRQWRLAFKDEELRLYAGIMLAASLGIAISLYTSGWAPFGTSLHQSAFTVSSVMTTTGFTLANFDLWPQVARTILLILMIFGAMAGSTGGGFKMARLLILFKSIKMGLHRLVHPRSVKRVQINGRPLDDEIIARNQLFLAVYCALALAVFLIISADGLSIESNLAAMLSCLNNVGPGMAESGPMYHYAVYSHFSRFVLSLTMLLGRLEIFPILLLALPSTWRSKT